MIKRSTWITLIVFVALLLFAWYWSGSRTEETVVPTPGPDALWQLLTAEFDSFTVEDLVTSERLQLQRDPEFGWVLVGPIEGPANAGQVEQAVSWLANPVPTRILTPGGNLRQYGLEQPRYRITVRFESDGERQLEVGTDAPTGNSTYIQVPGDESVYIVNRFSLESVINLAADDLLVTPTPEIETTETMEPGAP